MYIYVRILCEENRFNIVKISILLLMVSSLGCPVLKLGRFQVWAQHIHYIYDRKAYHVNSIKFWNF